MIKVLFFLIFMPFAVGAQDIGVHFERELSWQQIESKAKVENKYIFVDCFATWCGPCKAMDRNIFPLARVGDYYNANFISVKYQMDTSVRDNPEIIDRYSDAHEIMERYKVNCYPTFLFLSPDGNLLHRAAGGYDSGGIVQVAEDAIDPKKQYYRMIDDYRNGVRDTFVMKQLAKSTLMFGDKELSKQIAVDYVRSKKEEELYSKENVEFIRDYVDDKNLADQIGNKHINAIKESDIFFRDTILYIGEFTRTSLDRGFKIFLGNSSKIDKLVGKENYSQGIVDPIIRKEEITPFLGSASSGNEAPDWVFIKRRVSDKYGAEYAGRTITSAKVNWYQGHHSWAGFTRNLILLINKYGVDRNDYYLLNNCAWAVYEHSKKRKELKAALAWCESSIKLKPGYINCVDTYANILYKLGKKREAVSSESEALRMAIAKNDGNLTTIEKTLALMKKG